MGVYADIDQLIADYLPGATKPAEIAGITRLLENFSTFVDTYCLRPAGYFDPAGDAAVERRFRGENENFLRLPVHVFGSIETLKLDGQVLDPANYYESDRNGWIYLEDSVWCGIESGFGPLRLFQAGRTYKVTARWGYAATPLDLQEAVRQAVARIWETQKGTLGQLTPSGFVIERAMPVASREILDRYKRKQFEI